MLLWVPLSRALYDRYEIKGLGIEVVCLNFGKGFRVWGGARLQDKGSGTRVFSA